MESANHVEDKQKHLMKIRKLRVSNRYYKTVEIFSEWTVHIAVYKS
jgi:hypothetical protein